MRDLMLNPDSPAGLSLSAFDAQALRDAFTLEVGLLPEVNLPHSSGLFWVQTNARCLPAKDIWVRPPQFDNSVWRADRKLVSPVSNRSSACPFTSDAACTLASI